jgi:hypothetical protein
MVANRLPSAAYRVRPTGRPRNCVACCPALAPCTEVTILSDAADGPRSLGEAASVGPSHHVLDCLHLAMRIQHVAQAVRGWPDVTNEDRQERDRLADDVERIRWRLWHGQVQRALDLIGDTLAALDTMAAAPSSSATTAGKVAGVLRGLETYVTGQAELIIDYSTAPTGSTVQWLLHRRWAPISRCAGRREERILC